MRGTRRQREGPAPSRCVPGASLGSAAGQGHCGAGGNRTLQRHTCGQHGAAERCHGYRWLGRGCSAGPPLTVMGTAQPLHGGTCCKKTQGLLHNRKGKTSLSAHGQEERRLKVANTWLLPYCKGWGSLMPPQGFFSALRPRVLIQGLYNTRLP